MLELSKLRRMQIMEQITTQKERMSSAQRRKVVEKDYNNFVKTMNNFKQPKNNSALKISHQNSSMPRGNTSRTVQVDFLSYSPTVGDIPKPPTDRQQLSREFYEVTPKQQTPQSSKSPDKIKQVNFYQPDQSKKIEHEKTDKLDEMKEETSEMHSEVKDEEIHVPNVSALPSSVTNSDAIFFTSEFKQFIDRQSPAKEEQKPEIQPQRIQKQVKEQVSENNDKVLKSNKSRQSLAFSNNSSLRFSLNDSAVHEAITKKITEQLVLDSLGDSRFLIPIKNLAISMLMHQNYCDIIEFARQVYIHRQRNQKRKKIFIEQLLIQKEINLELRKDKIKIAQFREQKKQELFRQCFQRWRNQTESKRDKIQNFIAKRQAQIIGKSFRGLKMLLFDRKINNQIDTYYLSKVFFAFKSSVQKERKYYQQKAYKFYFKQLKRRIFNRFIDAVVIQRHENDLIAAADSNYGFNLLRKAFESWKEAMPVQQRFVRLAMTTHIQLKETQDKRLFQTRTFDFRQLR